MLSLCEGLAQIGARVTVYTTNANGKTRLDVITKQPLNVGDVTVWYFPIALKGLSFFYSPLQAKAVKDNINHYDIAILNSLYSYALIPSAKACIRSQTPFIIPTHGQLFSWALSHKGLKKKAYLKFFVRYYINRASAIHCTDPLEAIAVEKLGFRAPVIVVPNGLRVSDYEHPKKDSSLRNEFSISENARVLLFSGRIAHIKRPDIAIDTLAIAQSLTYETHLVIIGPDEDGLTDQLKAQAKSLGCERMLHFTGLLKHESVISALAETDLLLMPSEIQENFGMAALEALAAGVPILVSEGIPVGRWAQNAGAGRVVPCTTSAFREAALEILSNPEQLKEMGQRGRNLVKQHFDIEVVSNQMLAQCQAIVETGRPLNCLEPLHAFNE